MCLALAGFLMSHVSSCDLMHWVQRLTVARLISPPVERLLVPLPDHRVGDATVCYKRTI